MVLTGVLLQYCRNPSKSASGWDWGNWTHASLLSRWLHCSSRILQQLQSTSSILTTAILQVCDTTQDLQGSSSILVQYCQSAILQDLQSTSPIQVQQVSSCLPGIGEAQRVLVCFPDGLYCSFVILQDLQGAILPKWACLLEIGEAQRVPVGSRGAAVRVHSSKSLF